MFFWMKLAIVFPIVMVAPNNKASFPMVPSGDLLEPVSAGDL